MLTKYTKSQAADRVTDRFCAKEILVVLLVICLNLELLV